MLQKLKDLITYMHDHGIEIPLLKDHEFPSVSLTLLFISSLFVILGILSISIPKFHIEVNGWLALSRIITNAVLYYNRGAKVTKDGIEISSNNAGKTPEQE